MIQDTESDLNEVLIPTSNEGPTEQGGSSNEHQERSENSKVLPSYSDMIKQLFFSSLPVLLSMFLLFIDRSVIIYFLSKADASATITSAYSVANSVFMMLILSLVNALNTGLNSRCAQAYGAKNYELVGLLFHRGLLINISFMIPCLLPVLYAEPILMYIGTEDEVVHYAAEYVLYSVPSIIGIVIFFTLVSVLNACRQFMILGIATSANAIMFLIMASVFVGVLDGKIVGAAMASNLNFIFNIIRKILKIKLKLLELLWLVILTLSSIFS